ncbi:MOSC domain-containing protein [Coraliomargarita sp. W4R53]
MTNHRNQKEEGGDFAGAAAIARDASIGRGRVEYLINRPAEGVHEPVEELYLDVEQGILGDRWRETAWLRLPDGSPDPRVQVSLTNTRVIQCFTGDQAGAAFSCGDNIYTDLNLTEAHLPVGTRLRIGEAVLEVSDVPNDACGKFAKRFGSSAFLCVRRAEHLPLRLRGLFCRIVQGGRIALGDSIE